MSSAVVLGGSMAGLLAARVLADHFEQVTVVDRDPLDTTGPRRGVPQGRHAHGLLAAGLRVVDELFPGTRDKLIAAGVPHGDVLGNVRFCANGFVLKQAPVGMTAVSMSRPYLEDHVRGLVAELPNVTLTGSRDVIGLSYADSSGRVIGAQVQSRMPGGMPTVLGADLVVDATGRASRAARWLASIGYEAPAEERLALDLGYTSRHYRVSSLDGDVAIIIGPTPANPRGGAIQLEEDGRAVVTLFGILGDHAPTDDTGFQAFAESLPLPFIADAIRDAEPLDTPVLFRYPGSTRLRYDKLRRFPPGFLVVGDALCSFNPMYGQGMSVAAVEAGVLRDELRRGLDARRFFRAVRPVIDIPWQISTGGDLALPGVEGPSNPGVRFVNRYLARLHAVAAHDEVVSQAFIQVVNLLRPPPSLLAPRIMRRVLRGPRPAAPRPVAPV
jgi:2-polyprenyl-6-methoxyphenol hydroxylase-like FAD-dependent oxidoreductase